MKKLFYPMLIAFLCAATIRADEVVQKVITIKNGNRNGILHTIQDLGLAGVRVSTSDNDHVVVSGPKDAVTGIEEVIKQLDVPPVPKKDVETTIYMISASTQGAGTASLTPELDPVIKQLKAIFNYKNFRVLESFVLRSRDGERAVTSGSFLTEGSPGARHIRYDFHYRRVSLDGTDTSKSIRFDELSLSLKEGPNDLAGISTDVDAPEGKKVVVGKTGGIEGSDAALILVISAKVVD